MKSNKSKFVTISFPNIGNEKMKYMIEAEQSLIKAGINFDTGYDCCEKRRDWFFDWSLKGAIVKEQKKSLIKKIKNFLNINIKKIICHEG